MKRIKRWLRLPMVFEDKRDFIICLFMVFLLGIGCGYAWRMIQIERLFLKEIHLIERENNVIKQENRMLNYKISDLESQIGIIKGKGKKK